MSTNQSLISKVKRKTMFLLRKVTSNLVLVYVEKRQCVYGLTNQTDIKENITVSLTTFPARFDNLPICLKSILFQSVKPNRIIVWLDENVDENEITVEMRNLQMYGVEYRIAKGNLKPHKKYIHAMTEFPNDIIITVDDDIVYSPFTISSLLKTHKKYPHAICARRVHKMKWSTNGDLMSYGKWEWENINDVVPRKDLFACGVGGVLYPPHLLPKETFDMGEIERLCLCQDDIWLKFMEIKNNIPVVWTQCLLVQPPIIDASQEIALSAINVEQNRNDYCFEVMLKEYPNYDQLFKEQ